MATRNPSDLMARLGALCSQSGGHPLEFESVLAEIVRLDDPSCIKGLLILFEDEAEFDELMFSIIHTVESFGVRTYIEYLLRGLPALWKKSPRWAVILHMRILNDSESSLTYASLLETLRPLEREAVRDVLI